MATDIKFVCVATGFNDGRANSFTRRATNHANFIVRQLNTKKGKPDSPLQLPALVHFIHFDWQNDQILVYEHPFPEKGLKQPNPVWKELSVFAPSVGIDPKSFITKSATVGSNRVGISIVDVYRAVRKAPRASVLDVSVYSHGFIDGPVVENTSDSQLFATTGEPIRTDSDLDGRGRSDFTPHMGEKNVTANKDALKDFREGFAPGATFRIFGCHVQDIVDATASGGLQRDLIRSTVFQVIRAAFIVQLLKNTPAGTELRRKKKPASVRLDMGNEFAIEDSLNDNIFTSAQLKKLHYAIDPLFFPDKDTGPPIFDKPFTDVIKFIARQTKLGYVFKAAQALPAVTCFGAVPGSGGDYELTGNKLMFVPKHTYNLILQFFKDFMGVTLDERNYGRFDATSVAAINDRELNG